MKTGDPKQAAILGLAAVAALGFLGSTLFSTYASGSTPSPAPESVAPPADPVSTMPTTVEKLPDQEPSENPETERIGPDDLPPKMDRTPFAKAKSGPGANANVKVSQTKTSETDKRQHTKEFVQDHMGGSEGSEPIDPTKQNPLPGVSELPAGEQAQAGEKLTPKVILVKYEGYVEAGNPVAIIRIGESQYTADQGEGLPNGIRVIAITPEKLTLSIRGRNKSVWIGREVQL